ncbi:MAG: S8 family serine peptidase [Zavarzinia sp.]|nr:S8 family serine peptidase [Zavarzinia sp.]
MSDLLFREATSASFADFPGTTLEPVDVAVIDSGVDATHPDLAGRVASQWTVEEAEGRLTALELETGINNDTFGHGTAVAGIIARIAPNARIHDIRVLDARNRGDPTASLVAFRHVLAKRHRLINMSLAIPASQRDALYKLCESAYQRNQVVVAAKRNVPVTDEGLPAEFSSVISIDNHNVPEMTLRFIDQGLIEFATLGNELTVPAPGGGYTVKTGTSFATPTVTGMCCLFLGRWPTLRQFELKTILKARADAAV